jgi:hypothetical protein
MNEAFKSIEMTADAELIRISRAVRFGLAAIVIGLSYPNIHCALGIDNFRQVYADMLGNKPLAAATVFMVRFQPLFVGLSILFPVLAVTTIFTPAITRSIYVAGFLVLAVFAQLFFQWFTLTGPLFDIIRGMSAQ